MEKKTMDGRILGTANDRAQFELQALLRGLGWTMRLLQHWSAQNKMGRQSQSRHRPFHPALEGRAEHQGQSRALLLPLQSRQERHRPARNKSMAPYRTAARRDRRHPAHQSREAQTAAARIG